MTAVDPQPDMQEWALTAHDAGLCVIRARTDGTKRPYGEWKHHQSERPTRDEVASWFAIGHQGMGAVCGAVSGNLEMFELEGRFVARYGTDDFVKRMKAAGLELLLKQFMNGIVTRSPSDGRHFLYRVDGPIEGNTKLAANTDLETMIETRGEGGFVMLPPSHGTTHPSGKPWTISKGGYASIPTITGEQRAALFAVARSYDEAPPAPPVTPPAPTRQVKIRQHTGTVGASYFDAVVEHLKATTTVRSILESHGWTYEYTDRHGRDILKRPGKDTDGASGSINDSGRLLAFSSSTPFDFYRGSATKTPTYDHLDVIAMYEHGGDRQAAARYIAETVGIMDAYKREKDAQANPQPQPQVHGTDTITGEVEAPTYDDLWTERPVFEHILQAARSRLVSPFAVLGCVLARVAAFTPPTTCLPPTIGGTAPLSLYIALHGASGDGKSSPAECAAALLPHVPEGCKGPLGLGSGEGLIEAYLDRVEEKGDDGKTRRVQKQTYHGILFTLDEGEILGDIGSRKGSTIMPILRTAWSGSDLGQANAGEDTKRHLKGKRYHLGLVTLWQDDAGATLLADATGGTPQRFVWMPTADAGLERIIIPWPGSLDWQPPNFNKMGDEWFYEPLELPDEITTQIRHDRWDVLQRVVKLNPLDAHRNLNKLRVAGILAVLDSRKNITADDWRIAERLMCISDAVRDMLIDRTKQHAVERVRVDAVKHAMRDAVVESSANDRALQRAAKAVWRTCDQSTERATKRDITHRITGRDRALVSVDEAITEAVRLRWIKGDVVKGWATGEAKPA